MRRKPGVDFEQHFPKADKQALTLLRVRRRRRRQGDRQAALQEKSDHLNSDVSCARRGGMVSW